jgi:hypothetical protein
MPKTSVGPEAQGITHNPADSTRGIGAPDDSTHSIAHDPGADTCRVALDSPDRTDLAANVHEVLEAWRRRIRATAADQPRTGGRGVREEALVRSLLAPTDPRSPDADGDRCAVVLAATADGQHQPSGRVDPATLCTHLGELRQVIWEELRTTCAPQDATERILRLDRALTVVLRASINGSCRAELERRGEGPEVVTSLLGDATASARDASGSK